MKKIVTVIVFVLPVLLGLLLVLLFGVNGAVGDQLDIVPPLLAKQSAQQLRLADLAAFHNEHRILFPRLIMLVLARLTRYSNIAEMLFIQLLLALSLLILLMQFRARLAQRVEWLWFAPVPFLLFSWRQWETMLYGVQIAYILPVFCVLLSFFALDRLEKGWRGVLAMAAAMLCASIASFSLLPGLFAWPAGLLLLLLKSQPGARKKWWVLLWLLAGISHWLLYFHGFQALPRVEAPLAALPQLLALASFFLACLGNALIGRYIAVLILTGMGLVAFLPVLSFWLTRARCWGRNAFSIALLFFSLLAVMSIALGRFQLGIRAGLGARYSTFALLFTIAVYMLLLDLKGQQPQRLLRPALAFLLLVILLSTPLAYYRGLVHGRLQKQERMLQAWTLATFAQRSDDELKQVHPRPQAVRQGAAMLQRLKYNVFATK